MKSLRPATAGSNRSAMEHRPLGRSPMPVRLQAAVNVNSITSQVAALKGEVIMLQHRFEEARLQGEAHNDMEALERRLMTLNCVFPDDGSTNIDVKCTLLEIMLEQIKSISAAAMERCGEKVDPSPVPSRSHNFLRLIDFLVGLADRKREWDARVEGELAKRPLSVATSESGGEELATADHASRRDLTTLDLAMNEPTAAEVRKLVAEQKQLQEQIKAVLSKTSQEPRKDPRKSIIGTIGGGSSSLPPSHGVGVGAASVPLAGSSTVSAAAGAVVMPTSVDSMVRSGPTSDQVAATIAALQAKVDALMLENNEYKKRVSTLENSVSERIEFDEVPMEVAKRVRGLAFGCDYARLLELGIQVPTKPILADDAAGTFATKISALLSEFSAPAGATPVQAVTPGPGQVKGGANAKQDQSKKEPSVASSGPAVMEGLLWSTLQQQSLILTEVLNKHQNAQNELKATLGNKDAELSRLQRVIATLEQRIQLLKVQNTKTTLAMEAEAANIRKEADQFKKLYEDHLMSQSSTTKRIVNAKGQVATAEERERTLKEEIASRQQSIGDLTEQLKALKARLEEEQTASAVVIRERQQLIQARDSESLKVNRLMMEAKDREETLLAAKESLLLLKKEMREKSVAETEAQQKTWKLEVELHIAQNVITELRQREAELSKVARDAETCREELQEEVYRLRDEIADNQANHDSKLEDARQELQSAKSMLKQERDKLMAQELEVERLRIVDLKMESLEQNFTNYAASKIAQREAGEEEERLLGACLEALAKDPFVVPREKEGEAQLQLHIKELQIAKEQYEADERLRKRSKGLKPQDDENTNKKKLILLLQARLTDIQLYTCRARLKQMQLERDNRNQYLEIKQLQASQEAILQELSQARLQCEALAHRNSELEIERKQFMKQRSSVETEVKNLKANSQRLRVSHDEQEKLLVDMGTRLQSARMHVDASKQDIQPLPGAVIGIE